MPFCNQCKTKYHGPCKQGTRDFFNCGQMGNQAKDYIKAPTASINQVARNTIANENPIGQGVNSRQGGKG